MVPSHLSTGFIPSSISPQGGKEDVADMLRKVGWQLTSFGDNQASISEHIVQPQETSLKRFFVQIWLHSPTHKALFLWQ